MRIALGFGQFRLGALCMGRMNVPGTCHLSWHSWHSLTWRWSISIGRFRTGEARARPLWWGYRTNGGPHWGFRVPWICIVTCQTQRPMWYRDLYHARYQREDKALPEVPLVIVDGGQSVH